MQVNERLNNIWKEYYIMRWGSIPARNLPVKTDWIVKSYYADGSVKYSA